MKQVTHPPLLTCNRRRFLAGGAQGVSLAALGAALGIPASALAADQGIIGSGCLTILYQNGDDVHFDYDYYRDNHLTLIMDRYAGSIERFELRRPVNTEGAPPPAYVAAVNIWISDAEAFAAAGQANGAEVAADVTNFTNTQLIAQTDTVWAESGGGLHSTEMGQRCLTILYPREDGATWNADYYRDGHMPLIMDLYGTRAIRRFEVRKGPEQGAFMGTVNIYIEDQDAFDAAGAEHTQTLVDDVPNFSSVFPVVVTTEIFGTGV